MKHLKMQSYEKNDYLNSPFAAWIVDGFFLDYLFILEEQPHMFQSVFPSNAGQVMEFLLLTLLSMGEQKCLETKHLKVKKGKKMSAAYANSCSFPKKKKKKKKDKTH